ncbi:MAG: hypothetical protein ACK4RK_11080 [Gemmataceae bacterium]
MSRWLRRIGGSPCFRVHGKARVETAWRVIQVYATHRRDADSRWPILWRGMCITWTPEVVVIGWDFAEQVVREQMREPASRQHPLEVIGGRIGDPRRRLDAGGPSLASCSEVIAHEIGHTWQALRLGDLYLPVVGAVTWFREGAHWWNHFENEASEIGQFGGLVNGSVYPELMTRCQQHGKSC